MKKNSNSYSSVKTVSSLRQAVSLTLEQSEALKEFFASYNFQGDLEVTAGEVTLQLKLRGLDMPTLWKAEDEEYKLFEGKSNILSETLWEKEIVAFLKKDWEGSLSALEYGELRNQMSQKARGYESKASKAKGAEAMAYRELASKLRDKREVRAMLSFLKGARVILVNTFQHIGRGKIRVAYLQPERNL